MFEQKKPSDEADHNKWKVISKNLPGVSTDKIKMALGHLKNDSLWRGWYHNRAVKD